MLILGIETSCDETAAAVVDDRRVVHAHRVLSQEAAHAPYGGVVPEIAARAHLDHVDRLVAEALADAGAGFADLDGIAATAGPGLIGGVIVGVMTAKAIAAVHGLPFAAVNHLEAHALTVRLTDDVRFPYLLLLVSGGHCQLQWVGGVGTYRALGSTIDDAVGECFDKTAKMLGLGYPGGPAVERAAAAGDPGRFDLPRPMVGRSDPDFSFSGLKTAVRRHVEALGTPDQRDIADLCAGLQASIGDCLADRTATALAALADRPRALVVAGGVAANQALRGRLQALAAKHGLDLVAPPPRLCTDNGAMVAWAGLERLRLGLVDDLTVTPRPRWPLDSSAS